MSTTPTGATNPPAATPQVAHTPPQTTGLRTPKAASSPPPKSFLTSKTIAGAGVATLNEEVANLFAALVRVLDPVLDFWPALDSWVQTNLASPDVTDGVVFGIGLWMIVWGRITAKRAIAPTVPGIRPNRVNGAAIALVLGGALLIPLMPGCQGSSQERREDAVRIVDTAGTFLEAAEATLADAQNDFDAAIADLESAREAGNAADESRLLEVVSRAREAVTFASERVAFWRTEEDRAREAMLRIETEGPPEAVTVEAIGEGIKSAGAIASDAGFPLGRPLGFLIGGIFTAIGRGIRGRSSSDAPATA